MGGVHSTLYILYVGTVYRGGGGCTLYIGKAVYIVGGGSVYRGRQRLYMISYFFCTFLFNKMNLRRGCVAAVPGAGIGGVHRVGVQGLGGPMGFGTAVFRGSIGLGFCRALGSMRFGAEVFWGQ